MHATQSFSPLVPSSRLFLRLRNDEPLPPYSYPPGKELSDPIKCKTVMIRKVAEALEMAVLIYPFLAGLRAWIRE